MCFIFQIRMDERKKKQFKEFVQRRIEDRVVDSACPGGRCGGVLDLKFDHDLLSLTRIVRKTNRAQSVVRLKLWQHE